MLTHLTSSTILAALLAGAPQDDVARRANAELSLHASHVLPVLLDGELGGALRATLVLESATLTLDLTPHTVRTSDYQVLAQTDDGSLIATDPGPVRTLRGSVVELPGALVAASLFDEGLYARILTPDGEEYWLEPLAGVVSGAPADSHALYARADVVELGHGCGRDLLRGAHSSPQPIPPSGGGVGTAGLQVAELACDTDYEYFLDHGGNTTARIESVVNTMNLQYESEVGITHALGTVIVRSSSNDPYTSSDAVTFLNQFRSEWNANQGGVARDVAQIFTGKEIDGGTIGIAWLGVICNSSYGYGLVQSDFNGNFASATDLSAHELGHNWNADHCSCTSNTMNPYITSSNTFHSTFTIPDITSFRDSRTCLDDDGGGGGGGGGGDPTDVHVDSITPTTVNQGKGQKSARATVVIRDDQGGAVSGAIVTVTFTGDVSATMSAATGGDGSVTFDPAGTKKGRFRWEVCVTDVSASLPYDSNDNAETCDQP